MRKIKLLSIANDKNVEQLAYSLIATCATSYRDKKLTPEVKLTTLESEMSQQFNVNIDGEWIARALGTVMSVLELEDKEVMLPLFTYTEVNAKEGFVRLIINNILITELSKMPSSGNAYIH